MKIALALLTLATAFGGFAHAETAAFSDSKPYKPATSKPQTLSTESIPRDKEAWWVARSTQLSKNAAQGADIAFVGDSITQGWEGAGKAAWAAHFASHWKCVNLGISGDRTENVLWRLNHGGNLGNGALKPKAFVILIGTNNAGHRKDSPEQIRDGVKTILDTLHDASPDSKVILTAIFPRTSDAKAGAIVLATNPLLKALAKKRGAVWFDINDKLAPGGKVTKEIFPDGLHLNADGYEIWASALEPVIAKTAK
jgi:lysophospholipase L1-like esterase